LRVEFPGQIDGMSGIGEADFFVFGSRVLHQEVVGFEIYGLTLEEYSPDPVSGQHLFGLVGLTVSMLN
jgi:hypothetical protein